MDNSIKACAAIILFGIRNYLPSETKTQDEGIAEEEMNNLISTVKGNHTMLKISKTIFERMKVALSLSASKKSLAITMRYLAAA